VPGIRQPVQTSLIVGIGTKIFGSMDLEAPATAAVRENRWEFMLTGAPILVVGGRGSPVNPVALSRPDCRLGGRRGRSHRLLWRAGRRGAPVLGESGRDDRGRGRAAVWEPASGSGWRRLSGSPRMGGGSRARLQISRCEAHLAMEREVSLSRRRGEETTSGRLAREAHLSSKRTAVFPPLRGGRPDLPPLP